MEDERYSYGSLGRPAYPAPKERVKLKSYCPENEHVYSNNEAYTTHTHIIRRCIKCGLSKSFNRIGSDPDERYRFSLGTFGSSPRYGMDQWDILVETEDEVLNMLWLSLWEGDVDAAYFVPTILKGIPYSYLSAKSKNNTLEF